MPDIVDTAHKDMSNEIKKSMAVYADSEDLINIGAYVRGSSADIDDAIDKNPAINGFLTQAIEAKYTLADAVDIMSNILNPTQVNPT
jgi:flagellum-specific ATP synthase